MHNATRYTASTRQTPSMTAFSGLHAAMDDMDCHGADGTASPAITMEADEAAHAAAVAIAAAKAIPEIEAETEAEAETRTDIDMEKKPPHITIYTDGSTMTHLGRKTDFGYKSPG